MSYQSDCTPKSGAISGSAADPMTWNLTPEQGRAVMVVTVTAAVDTTLHIQEAATEAELASPVLALPHKFSEPVTANTTKRVVIPRDPSLPWGKAWVAGGSGNYSMSGGRRAHS